MRYFLTYFTFYLYKIKLKTIAIFLINKIRKKKNTINYNLPTYIITSYDHNEINNNLQKYFFEFKNLIVVYIDNYHSKKYLKKLLRNNKISAAIIKHSNFIVIDDSKQNQSLLLRYLFSKSRGGIILFTTLEIYLTGKLIPWLKNEIYYYPDYIFPADKILKIILDNNNFQTLQNHSKVEVNNEYENFIYTLNKSITFVKNNRESYLGKASFYQLLYLYFYNKFYNIKKKF
ncbi:MAG: hypothetical protein QM538_05560 [Methylacidiphilales bacterium]|nr:hypothetical protein [Candidatus Methylacidiphilales bacterium]